MAEYDEKKTSYASGSSMIAMMEIAGKKAKAAEEKAAKQAEEAEAEAKADSE